MRRAYGGPPPRDEIRPRPKTLAGTKTQEDAQQPRPFFDPNPEAKSKIRVTCRIDEEGRLCLKSYRDGELVSEASGPGNGTLTVEFEGS